MTQMQVLQTRSGVIVNTLAWLTCSGVRLCFIIRATLQGKELAWSQQHLFFAVSACLLTCCKQVLVLCIVQLCHMLQPQRHVWFLFFIFFFSVVSICYVTCCVANKVWCYCQYHIVWLFHSFYFHMLLNEVWSQHSDGSLFFLCYQCYLNCC